MNKAFAYLRVSGRGQIEGDGFPRQRVAIEAYSRANNIRVVQWFEEKGISGGKELDQRPALQQLMTALHSNGTRLVLVEKLDRLARDLMIQETIIGDLRKQGFELVSVAEPDLCSDDPSRKLVRQVFGAISEYDRSMIVLKLRGARQRARLLKGRCEGRKPYGTRPGEREIIERMFAFYDQGSGYTSIHKDLNQEGILTREGKQWTASTVMRIMKREPERLHRATAVESFGNGATGLFLKRGAELVGKLSPQK